MNSPKKLSQDDHDRLRLEIHLGLLRLKTGKEVIDHYRHSLELWKKGETPAQKQLAGR